MRITMRILAGLAILCGAATAQPPSHIEEAAPAGLPEIRQVTAVTTGPNHHFAGYYGICPWSPDSARLFCLETTFADREVTAEDRATLGTIDLATTKFTPLTEVAAWNFQQGCLAHWLDNDHIIYNDRFEGDVYATVLDTRDCARRRLPMPLAAVSNDGKRVASISYARLNLTRPGYGYPGITAESTGDPHPDNDGLYVFDIDGGEPKLIVTLDQVFHHQPPPAERKDDTIWFNHVVFNPAGDRLFFLARFKDAVGRLISAAYTVHADGSGLHCLIPYGWNASHFDWRSNNALMVTTQVDGEGPWRHVLFQDQQDDYRVIAPGLLDTDGHCHFSDDGRWLVSDSYPQGPERMQSLFFIDMENGQGYEAARFQQPREFKGPWRCDLHPRWNRDGTRICIDSTHEGTRQVYIIDLDLPE